MLWLKLVSVLALSGCFSLFGFKVVEKNKELVNPKLFGISELK